MKEPLKIAPRREFLKATAAIAIPYIVPASVFGAAAPSNRISVACIGTGNQCMGVLLPKLLARDDVQVVAVCDVNRGSYGYKNEKDFYGREPAQKIVNKHYAGKTAAGQYQGCDAHNDFREVLDRKDVDAVVIAVPDHWHALMTIGASEAGKDIYCEKPLSLTVADGRAMVGAVRKHRRILQTGSHERSNPLVRKACELVRNGRIGELKKVTTFVGFHSKKGPGPGWQPMPVPDGFDYETWLGPAPDAPYHQDRCLYRFRFNYDYSGGQVTNYGAHSNDMAQWALGADDTGPVEVEYLHAKWLPKGSLFNAALETEFRCRYASGVELHCINDKSNVGARFEGSEGMIQVGYAGFFTEPASLKESEIGANEIHVYHSDDHIGNFIECIKSRKEPIAPVEVGHRSATVCHLGNIAVRLGRNLRWDPEKEEILGDEEASAMLTRPQRAPWTL